MDTLSAQVDVLAAELSEERKQRRPTEIAMEEAEVTANRVVKELNETSTWLRIIQGSFAVNPDFLSNLTAENHELCRILVASIQTARRNSDRD